MSVDYSDVLKEVYYDETSPTFIRWKCSVWTGWNNSVCVREAGGVAGGLIKSTGYCYVNLRGRLYSVHRIVYQLFNGLITEECLQVDHINGIRTDNHASNLRLVTGKENQRNRRMQSNNKTGVTGVEFETKIVGGKGFNYYIALLYDCTTGKTRKKYFSVSKLGAEEAFRLACEHRHRHVLALNKSGEGFTERHGI